MAPYESWKCPVADLDNLEFVNDQERQYFAQAQLGEQVYQFLHSPTGRYLHGCAKQEINALRDELERCDLDTRLGRWWAGRKIRKLQRKAAAARYFMQWCAEAINNGEFAYQHLTQQNQD